MQSHVHIISTENGISTDWKNQFEEIDHAWRKGDFYFARTWIQKLAYTLHKEDAPPAVHDKFKEVVARFAKDDPLYASIMSSVRPAIATQPGIIQSQLMKQFPQFLPEEFRYVMYYGEVTGEILREKKGRSYALTLP